MERDRGIEKQRGEERPVGESPGNKENGRAERRSVKGVGNGEIEKYFGGWRRT